MTLKEKLDLLWKYLLLIILVYGFAQIGRSNYMGACKPGGSMSPKHHQMLWKSDNCDAPGMKRIEVRIEKDSHGDSTVVVMVNGEEVDIDHMDISKIKKGDELFLHKGHKRDRDPNKIKMLKKSKLKDQ